MITLAEAAAILAASSAVTTGALFAIDRSAERWALWSATTAAAVSAGALLATCADILAAILAR
jgi:hypothetical protein